MTKNNAIVVSVIVSVAVIVLALIVLFVLKPTSSLNSVNVQGYAVVKAMPDLITVSFSIETKNKTSAGATTSNNEIYDKLVAELIALGIDRKEIVTESFNVYPNYDWNNGKQIDNGYVASHVLKVELSVNESNKISEIIDAGVNAGAGISYINFELTQESQNKYKAEAMKLAAEDARIKAESVAQGFNKKVGRLVSTSVSDFGYYPWNLYSTSGAGRMEDAVMAKEAVTSIQPGDKEITASVNAVFKLR
jgi:uncharacterized protein YggE